MMKVVLILVLLLFVGCGALKLSPQGCKSSGYWGAVSEKGSEKEIKYSQDYYVLMDDKEIRLRDFLKEKGVACEDIKKIRVKMSSVFFVKRVIDVYIVK